MGQFNGKRICGKPALNNFMTMVRPDLEGQCPEGFASCLDPEQSKPDNIVCLEIEDPEWGQNRSVYERCPINDIEIVKKSEVPNWE